MSNDLVDRSIPQAAVLTRKELLILGPKKGFGEASGASKEWTTPV